MQALDSAFPLIILIYGAFIWIALLLPHLTQGSRAFEASWAYQHLQSKKSWASLCLIVGTLWSLQQLYF